MGLVGLTLFLFFLGLFVAGVIVSAFFIWLGAKIAGVAKATFGKAVWAAIVTSLFVWALTGIASTLFGVGSVGGWILGVIITLFILKWIYKTTWGKALLTWLFCGIAHAIVLVIAVVLAMTGVIAAIGIFAL
jgi:hypothetical protein